MKAQLTFVHALSSLHAGTGRGAGVIDLPIARERATNLPFLPGSSLKGALRSRCMIQGNTEICSRIFGSADPDVSDNPGSKVQFSDQRLLLLPIRSLAGIFAWVTSPYVLRRFLRDMSTAQIKEPGPIPEPEKPEQCLFPTNQRHLVVKINEKSEKVCLEDLRLAAANNPEVTSKVTIWAEWIAKQVFPTEEIWQHMLIERFCIVHDSVFNFLSETASEVSARIRLEQDSKTVQDGGLWYEETLPPETILAGIALATPINHGKQPELKTDEIFQKIGELTSEALQLGGKATVGRGLCQVQLAESEA